MNAVPDGLSEVDWDARRDLCRGHEPETLVGRKLIFVANLKPRKLRGLESQGMVLAASVGDEGKPVLATFTEDVPNGARLK